MPRYVFSLAVGGQYYVTDEHGMELDTLYDVHTKALRILEQTFPFAPDHPKVTLSDQDHASQRWNSGDHNPSYVCF